MGAQFWVSDLHLGHKKVAELRGFEDTIEHDEAILSQLQKLPADARVWVLGDISSGRPEGEFRALELLKTVAADLHLIAGNHDSVSGIHRNGFKAQRKFLEVFESVQDFTRVKFYGTEVVMSHYPYARSGDGPGRGEARYLQWRLPDVGAPLIHGHTHQSTPHARVRMPMSIDKVHFMSEQIDTQQLCVSWDAWRRIVTEKDITDWIKKFREDKKND